MDYNRAKRHYLIVRLLKTYIHVKCGLRTLLYWTKESAKWINIKN